MDELRIFEHRLTCCESGRHFEKSGPPRTCCSGRPASPTSHKTSQVESAQLLDKMLRHVDVRSMIGKNAHSHHKNHQKYTATKATEVEAPSRRLLLPVGLSDTNACRDTQSASVTRNLCDVVRLSTASWNVCHFLISVFDFFWLVLLVVSSWFSSPDEQHRHPLSPCGTTAI